jgi:hypothetical protein
VYSACFIYSAGSVVGLRCGPLSLLLAPLLLLLLLLLKLMLNLCRAALACSEYTPPALDLPLLADVAATAAIAATAAVAYLSCCNLITVDTLDREKRGWREGCCQAVLPMDVFCGCWSPSAM